jgi:hypothetical protein
MSAIISDGNDATFYTFKPRGKWKYEGRGHFPQTDDGSITYQDVLDQNDQRIPGMSCGDPGLTIVIIPDHDCAWKFAYPRMILGRPG